MPKTQSTAKLKKNMKGNANFRKISTMSKTKCTAKLKKNMKGNANLREISTMPKTQSTAKLKKNVMGNANLRETMLSRMDSARLRFLNDEMYNNNKSVLKKKTAFKVYHDSFNKQQKLWDSNPLDIIIKDLKSQYSKCLKKDEFVIADLGCGVAKIADEFEETEAKVHSIDFVAVNKKVTACDMAHTNIQGLSVDNVVFCLSLMSSNCNSYIKEAKRILKPSGILLIAEVTSRIGNEQAFIEAMKSYGFSLNGKTYVSKKYFTYFKFKNNGKIKSKPSDITLQPCKYKKR